MNMLTLSLAYMRHQGLTMLLNLLLLALGIATVTVLLLFSQQLEQRLSRDAQGIDLVVGPSGSPLQLILSSLYHIDMPTGNIPLGQVRWLKDHPLVETAMPLAMGDSYGGFRIVGTESSYIRHYGGTLRDGRLWEHTMDAVLGAKVAARTGLRVGDSFAGVHGITAGVEDGGHVHDDRPYTVVGTLEPTGTVLDRLIVAPLESVWMVHDHDHQHDHDHDHEHVSAGDDREISALLVQYRSALGAVSLPRMVDSRPTLQAAAPARETTRLLSMLGIGLDALRVFGWLLVFTATLGVFIALYNALQQNRYDYALMRSLGASRAQLLLHTLLQGLLLALAGAALGLIAGHLVAEMLGQAFGHTRQLSITGWVWLPQELWLLALAVAVGLLAALIPAIQAYRTDIATTLNRGD